MRVDVCRKGATLYSVQLPRTGLAIFGFHGFTVLSFPRLSCCRLLLPTLFCKSPSLSRPSRLGIFIHSACRVTEGDGNPRRSSRSARPLHHYTRLPTTAGVCCDGVRGARGKTRTEWRTPSSGTTFPATTSAVLNMSSMPGPTFLHFRTGRLCVAAVVIFSLEYDDVLQ